MAMSKSTGIITFHAAQAAPRLQSVFAAIRKLGVTSIPMNPLPVDLMGQIFRLLMPFSTSDAEITSLL
jgi:hypothetical protein